MPKAMPTLTQPTIAAASSAQSELARGEICGGYGDNSTTALSAACSCLRDCWLSSSGTRDDDAGLWLIELDGRCLPVGHVPLSLYGKSWDLSRPNGRRTHKRRPAPLLRC